MLEDIELIRFNMTDEMSIELVNFNNLKKELKELEELYNKDNDIKLKKKIDNLNMKINESRDNFIREFRINNVHEIEEYLNHKSQNC